MFLTPSGARHPVLSALSEGSDVWTTVRFTAMVPAYCCTYTLHSEDGDLHQTVMLGSHEQVAEILEQASRKITVSEVQLLSPGWLNKKGLWKMEPLSEIQRATTPCGDQVLVYRLSDNSAYIDHHAVGAKLDELTDVTTLLAFGEPQRGQAVDSDSEEATQPLGLWTAGLYRRGRRGQ